MRLFIFRITLFCFIATSVFARIGDTLPAHAMGGEQTVNSAVEIVLNDTAKLESDGTKEPCACKESPGSTTSITCGIVLAMPTDSLKLMPPTVETGKLQVASRYGFKLFLPIRKKPPRTFA